MTDTQAHRDFKRLKKTYETIGEAITLVSNTTVAEVNKLRAENERLRRILKPCIRLIVNIWPSNWNGGPVLQEDGGISAQDEREGLAEYVESGPDIHKLFKNARDVLVEAHEALKEPDDA